MCAPSRGMRLDDEPSGIGHGGTGRARAPAPSTGSGRRSWRHGGTGGTGGTGGDPFIFDDTPFDAYMQTDRHGAVEAGTVGIAAAFGPRSRRAGHRDPRRRTTPATPWKTRRACGSRDQQQPHGAARSPRRRSDGAGAHARHAGRVARAGRTGHRARHDQVQPGDAGGVSERPRAHRSGGRPHGRGRAPRSGRSPAHHVLADLPLNPDANDVPFKAEFPYLADPH